MGLTAAILQTGVDNLPGLVFRIADRTAITIVDRVRDGGRGRDADDLAYDSETKSIVEDGKGRESC